MIRDAVDMLGHVFRYLGPTYLLMIILFALIVGR